MQTRAMSDQKSDSDKDSSSAPAQASPANPAAAAGGNGGGKGLAIVALLLALAAAGAAGYSVWQQQQLLSGRVQADNGRAEQLQRDTAQRLADLRAAANLNSAAVADTQRAVAEALAAVADLSQRFAALDDRVAGLSGTTADRRNRLLRDEAVYYMRIANAQALLAKDAGVAASALELADEKLRETGDPAYTRVRGKLSEEITALRAVPETDTAGVIFRLQSLGGQLGDWPLRNPVPERFTSEVPALDNAAELDTWGRFKATLRAAFDSIVSIRQSEAPREVQLTNAEYALVRESLRAELQLARVTFIGGQYALFGQSLTRAQALITEYFDTEATPVQAALATLAELEGTEMPGALPDVSGSLSMLLKPQSGEPATQSDAGAAQ